MTDEQQDIRIRLTVEIEARQKAETDNERLKAEVAELKEMLKSVEWVDFGDGSDAYWFCARCVNEQANWFCARRVNEQAKRHDGNCKIDKALTGKE